MGCAKRKLELSSKQKERTGNFQKKMEGLKKKAFELKTLCGVEVGLIVMNGPKLNDSPLIEEPQIWPSDPDLIKQLIASHNAQNLKMKRKITELDMYPTWDNRYDVLSINQLEEFEHLVGEKLQYLNTKMETMRRDGNCFGKGKQMSTRYEISEMRNTCDSFVEKQVSSSENSAVNLTIESDSCYNQLEDLYSSEFLRGLMDEPIASNLGWDQEGNFLFDTLNFHS